MDTFALAHGDPPGGGWWLLLGLWPSATERLRCLQAEPVQPNAARHRYVIRCKGGPRVEFGHHQAGIRAGADGKNMGVLVRQVLQNGCAVHCPCEEFPFSHPGKQTPFCGRPFFFGLSKAKMGSAFTHSKHDIEIFLVIINDLIT